MSLMARLTETCARTDLSNEYRGYFDCPTPNALLTLSPGLLNLVPLLLLLHPAAPVKLSAAIAGALGVLRTIIPALFVAISGGTVGISCAEASCVFETDYFVGVLFAGIALWDATAIALLVVLTRATAASLRQHLGRRYLFLGWAAAIPFALLVLCQILFVTATCLNGNCG